MKIEHVALWVRDLERMKSFYETYFNGQANEKYQNHQKGFESYFISFDNGPRIEIMRKIGVSREREENQLGWAHIAMSIGSKEAVDEITNTFRIDGYKIVSGPRLTGDGYYESVIEDFEGNLIELTI